MIIPEEIEKKYIYEQTEEYALKKQYEEAKWWANNETEYLEIMECINQLLGAHTLEAEKEFEKIFFDIERIERLGKRADFSFMFILYKIYAYEKQIGIKEKVLSIVDSVEDAKDKMDGLRYILWRIEFAEDEYAIELLVKYIVELGISPAFLLVIIETSCNAKEQMKEIVKKILDAAGLVAHKHMIEKISINVRE